MSLILVGVLAVTMTPGRSKSPQALLESTLVATTLARGSAIDPALVTDAANAELTGATATPLATTPAVTTGPSGPTTQPASSGATAPASDVTGVVVAAVTTTIVAVTTPAASGTTPPSPAPSDGSSSALSAVRQQSPVIVTPVGDGLAITTQAAMGSVVDDPSTQSPMTAALPSGSAVDVDVVATDGDLVVLSILSGSTAEDRSLASDATATRGPTSSSAARWRASTRQPSLPHTCPRGLRSSMPRVASSDWLPTAQRASS